MFARDVYVIFKLPLCPLRLGAGPRGAKACNKTKLETQVVATDMTKTTSHGQMMMKANCGPDWYQSDCYKQTVNQQLDILGNILRAPKPKRDVGELPAHWSSFMYDRVIDGIEGFSERTLATDAK